MSIHSRRTERRSITRHQLKDYLLVYNRNTGKPLGNIGNISCNGLMLISRLPMLTGAVFNLRIQVPEDNNTRNIDFDARCHWCKPDVDPASFDSGYSIVNPDEDVFDLVEELRQYFTFADS
ncbi:PilZ domain-containing protein [Spongorhabdus nitratireducens]